MMQEYKNIRAIYPPKIGTICKACYSCGNDVKTDKGFADLSKPAFKGFLCASCATIAIGGNKCAELLEWAQETYRKSAM